MEPATEHAKEVKALLEKLVNDLNQEPLSSDERYATVARLKILGRDVKHAAPLFEEHGIRTVARQGFDRTRTPDDASREALRCLSNALLLQQQTRQILVDLGYADKAAEALKECEADDEFLYARILFFLTYNTNLDFGKLVENHDLGASVTSNLRRHATHVAKAKGDDHGQLSQIDEMALSESLKLLFNINHFRPDLADSFAEAFDPILTILKCLQPPAQTPLSPPFNYLINAMLNSRLEAVEIGKLFPAADPTCHVKSLLNILDLACSNYSDSDFESNAAPLMTLLRRIYEHGSDKVGQYMQSALLPTEEEREKPLGKSDSLPSRLLQLTMSPNINNLRDLISGLLFELSNKDAAKFVENIGYGHASGFLMNNNISLPSEFAQEGAPGNAANQRGANGKARSDVNFVTGQYLANEPREEGPPMTEEEKMREAERLFVLFERLKKTGVVDVKNPVEEAVDSGRFEELDE